MREELILFGNFEHKKNWKKKIGCFSIRRRQHDVVEERRVLPWWQVHVGRDDIW